MGILAVTVDTLHALAMVFWLAGLPLLVWRRRPSLTRAYAMYAVTFVVVSQLSQWVLGECFLTSIARWFWEAQPAGAPRDVSDWFTVRFAHAVFGFRPSHRSVIVLSEALIVLTAILALRALRAGASRTLSRPSLQSHGG